MPVSRVRIGETELDKEREMKVEKWGKGDKRRFAVLTKDNYIEEAPNHYIDGIGKIQCTKTKDCPACLTTSGKLKSQKRKRWGVHIFEYEVDKNFALQPCNDPDIPILGNVRYWDIDQKKYDQLHSIVQLHGDITKVDLGITTTKVQWQEVMITALQTSEWQQTEERIQYVLNMLADNLVYGQGLESFFGKEYSVNELMEVMESYAEEKAIPFQISSPDNAQDIPMLVAPKDVARLNAPQQTYTEDEVPF